MFQELCAWFIFFSGVADKVTVSIPAGEVTGRVVKLKDGTVHEFLGMPFAEPPVGSLRYKDPVIMESFPGLMVAHSVLLPSGIDVINSDDGTIMFMLKS